MTDDREARHQGRPGAGVPHGTETLRITGLRVGFGTGEDQVLAVDGVDLALTPGRVHALVGESGSGKSVTGLTVLGLTRGRGTHVSGAIDYAGRDLVPLAEPELRGLRGRELAMVFQDPMTSLNPLHRVGRQIAEMVRLHDGAGKREAMRRAVELLGEVGIPEPERAARAYPHEFSGGMRQRVMIAIALACRPRVLIADEPTTALDVTIQAQILNLIRTLCQDYGTAVLLVTHDLGVVAQYADEVSVMYVGEVVETGTVAEVLAAPRHPYTRGLLDAIPRLRGARKPRLATIAGSVPVFTAATAATSGCRFAARCGHEHDACGERPPMRELGPGRAYRCWLEGEESP
ncbi:ABC transporter ATP-binding protein [Amycolatopsis sp. K13G38]|uniref:ABC transporter ATP-binding protein n=1 Tax=Amycolatopsis acididurans TaxID=2724524 RepID=A0ABX1IV08_9PSEU|nr:ABC transporter ATP-binding protein [Amycolatopsis acididurans]NKQ51333.1 ABC transporter ATP-binding protein [Amycolatopsis acididurans]